MSNLAGFTPRAVSDLFDKFSADDKAVFIANLVHKHGPQVFTKAYDAMAPSEQRRFTDFVVSKLREDLLPGVVLDAIVIVRENPEINDEDLRKELMERAGAHLSKAMETARETERLKRKKRERQSDPAIVRRNVALCDKHDTDKKKWSATRLAKDYNATHPKEDPLTRENVKLVLRDARKWRIKLAELGSE